VIPFPRGSTHSAQRRFSYFALFSYSSTGLAIADNADIFAVAAVKNLASADGSLVTLPIALQVQEHHIDTM